MQVLARKYTGYENVRNVQRLFTFENGRTRLYWYTPDDRSLTDGEGAYDDISTDIQPWPCPYCGFTGWHTCDDFTVAWVAAKLRG